MKALASRGALSRLLDRVYSDHPRSSGDVPVMYRRLRNANYAKLREALTCVLQILHADQGAVYLATAAGGYRRVGSLPSGGATQAPRFLTSVDAAEAWRSAGPPDSRRLLRFDREERCGGFALISRETGALRDSPESRAGLQLFCDFCEQTFARRAATWRAGRAGRLLHAVLDSAQCAIFVVEPDRRLSLAGRPVEAILGVSASEATLETIYERLPREDRIRSVRSYLRARNRLRSEQLEVRMVGAAGLYRTLRVTFSPLKGLGRTHQVIGVADDITELKRMGRRLLQASRLTALGELTAGVAHEITQPLNALAISTRLLQDYLGDRGFIDDFLFERIRSMNAMLARATRIVEQLRKFGRRSELETAPCRPCAPVEDAVELVAARLEKDEIRCCISAAAGLPEIHCDPIALEQVFINLLINASDAIAEARRSNPALPGNIDVYVAPDADGCNVQFTVADNGAGIPAGLEDAVFLPFFTTKPVGQGVGLGLSISFGIVRDHGGSLSVQSRPGETVFSVTIPTTKERIR